MTQHLRLSLGLAVAILALDASAQEGRDEQTTEEQSEASPTPGIWKAEMPAGDYIVRLRGITSISRHEYVVEGVGRVAEVTISAAGPALARFYVLEPNVPQAPGGLGQSAMNFAEEKIREATSRAGAEDVWRQVVKSYPAATHAHTVEYRLSSLDELAKLFASVEKAFMSGRGETFRP